MFLNEFVELVRQVADEDLRVDKFYEESMLVWFNLEKEKL